MMCSEPVGVIAFVVMAGCAASWLYWLKRIIDEVNPTRPEEERLTWRWTNWGPYRSWDDLRERWRVDWKIHWFWDEHGKLFPKSRKRRYAGISILLFVLVPVINLGFCLLVAKR